MASFADNEVSFTSGRSKSNSYKPKTKRVEPYVSPFVTEAKKRAEERVRERMSKYKVPRKSSPPPVKVHDSGEWNNNVQAPVLFDPQLRRQEIFRIEPRNQRPRVQDGNYTSDPSITNNRPPSKLTVRTHGDSPQRNPLSQRSLSPNEDRNPEYTDRNWPHHQQQHRVTRSTSPIDDRIMVDIYGADQENPSAANFTMRRQNGYRPSLHQGSQQFFRGQGRNGEKMDPQSMRDYYGNMIRERLRQLLQQHRDGKATQDASNPMDKSHPWTKRPATPGVGLMGGYARPAEMMDTQMMTRDLMASMAQIMTAVGEIVTNQQAQQGRRRRKDWYKDHPVPKSSPVAAQDQASTSSRSHETPPVIASARVKHPSKPTVLLSELAALSAAKGIAKLREKDKQNENENPHTVQSKNQPDRKEFMWDMAQALRPEVMLHEAVAAAENGTLDPSSIPFPKNKAAVFDMIFSKLQSIEQCEQDLITFLREPRETPESLPVDPILLNLQRQQRRKTKQQSAAQTSTSPSNYSSVVVDGTQANSIVPQSKPVEEAKRAASATFDFLKRYPPLGTISSCIRSDFEQYKEKLDRARKLRDAVFLKKNSDVSIAGDTVADALCDRIIGSVASEIGGFVEDYSKNYVGKL